MSLTRLHKTLRSLLPVLLALLLLCEAGCGVAPAPSPDPETDPTDPGKPEPDRPETEPDPPLDPEDPVEPVSGNPVLSVTYEYVDGRYVQVHDVGFVAGNTSTVQEAGLFTESSLNVVMDIQAAVSYTSIGVCVWCFTDSTKARSTR